jgi:hypothetical protein
MKRLWKITCMENVYPGMWQRWFKNQCVAVGWNSSWGFTLDDSVKSSRGWSRARNSLREMSVGDLVVVALRGHRVGRIGQITEKLIDDGRWEPLVPPGPDMPDGEMGRRINVRWDLTVGPDDNDLVVQLPVYRRFSSGELRPTVSEVSSMTSEQLVETMNDRANWVSLISGFALEKALSDYIANYPHNLEEGMLPYPNAKVREQVFADGTRSDVLLVDSNSTPVVVECKQHAPTVAGQA